MITFITGLALSAESLLTPASILGLAGNPKTAVVRVANGYKVQAGNTRVMLVYDQIDQGDRIRVVPPQDFTISFRLSRDASLVRAWEDESVFVYQTGNYGVENAKTFLLGGAEYLLTGASTKLSVGFAKVRFSKTAPALLIRKRARPPFLPIGLGGEMGGLIEATRAKLSDQSSAFAPNVSDKNHGRATLANALKRIFEFPGARSIESSESHGIPTQIAILSGPEGKYAAVTCLNFANVTRNISINFAALNLDPSRTYTIFDTRTGNYFPSVASTFRTQVEMESCHTFLIMPTEEHPSVLGSPDDPFWMPVRSGTEKWDDKRNTLSGSTRLAAGSELAIIISASANRLDWQQPTAIVNGRHVEAILVRNTVLLKLVGGTDGKCNWSVSFSSKTPGKAPKKENLALTFATSGLASIGRVEMNDEVAGYMMLRNDEYIGFFGESAAFDEGTTPHTKYSYELIPISHSGMPGESTYFVGESPTRTDLALHNLAPIKTSPAGLCPLRDRSAISDDQPLQINKRIAPGLGVMANSAYTYEVLRGYRALAGSVALEDRNPGSATFEILADGVSLWKSGLLKAGAVEEFNVDLTNRVTVTLKVSGTGGACWINPRLLAKPRP